MFVPVYKVTIIVDISYKPTFIILEYYLIFPFAPLQITDHNSNFLGISSNQNVLGVLFIPYENG